MSLCLEKVARHAVLSLTNGLSGYLGLGRNKIINWMRSSLRDLWRPLEWAKTMKSYMCSVEHVRAQKNKNECQRITSVEV